MDEFDAELTVFWVEVTESDLRTDKEKTLPTPKTPFSCTTEQRSSWNAGPVSSFTESRSMRGMKTG